MERQARERRVLDSYEQVPYPSSPQWQTHPDHLAALGTLFGLTPAPPRSCRLLELGCADGGNLIPMAFNLPQSAFVGIDLSPPQIDAGRRVTEILGLANLELRAMSLLDLDDGLGSFDYVVAHGVYSWVEPAEQEKILEICRRSLSANGIAYLSYNTFPGWHQRLMVREMMLYRAGDEPDLLRQQQAAVELMELLAAATAGRNDTHAVVLQGIHEHLAEYADRPSYVVHEYLEPSNLPCYFHQFVERAAAHGLQYLAEADAETMEIARFPATVSERLAALAGSRVEREQYMDFLTNRPFRRTLLCHREVELDLAPGPERLAGLHFAADARPVESEPGPAGVLSFRTIKAGVVSPRDPLTSALLLTLGEVWPRTLGFAELAERAGASLGSASGAGDPHGLADRLRSLFFTGVVEIHALPFSGALVGERPRASDLVRHQAAEGRLVTNARHRVLAADDSLARFLLVHLDGTRTRADLVELLKGEVEAGKLDIAVEGTPIADPAVLSQALAGIVEAQLARMAENLLLADGAAGALRR